MLMLDICWLIDCLWTSPRVETRAYARSTDEIQDSRLVESTGPSMILKMPWYTIFTYGLIDHNIVREITLFALKTTHPDKNDVTFTRLEKDLVITATNLSNSYFSDVLNKLLQTCL